MELLAAATAGEEQAFVQLTAPLRRGLHAHCYRMLGSVHDAGTALNHRNVATRGVEKAAAAAGLGKVTPKVLRASFCSLAGRRGVDPIEASQLTGHSLAVWARHYARSFGKAQRDEARGRMLEHGFGAAAEEVEA